MELQIAMRPDLKFELLPSDGEEMRSTGTNQLIRSISSHDEMSKFGSFFNGIVLLTLRSKQCAKKIKCVQCNTWLPGICHKHPVIFIKEKAQTNPGYTSRETLPPFFYLAPSTIPHAGIGIFTSVPLPAGLCFGPYGGTYDTERPGMSNARGYAWSIFDREAWVDARNDTHSNWMRFANCPRFVEEQNFYACSYKGQMYYFTYKPIPSGSELMVWYGGSYGQKLRVPRAMKNLTAMAPPKKAGVDYEHLSQYETSGESTSESNVEGSSSEDATSTSLTTSSDETNQSSGGRSSDDESSTLNETSSTESSKTSTSTPSE